MILVVCHRTNSVHLLQLSNIHHKRKQVLRPGDFCNRHGPAEILNPMTEPTTYSVSNFHAKQGTSSGGYCTFTFSVLVNGTAVFVVIVGFVIFFPSFVDSKLPLNYQLLKF